MRLAIAAVVVAFASCKTATTAQHNDTTVQPSVIVYKTKVDYRNLVPVTLSDDKSAIVSYPAPTDLKQGDSYSYPTALHNGYLIDNRGIGKNTAFLKLTYAEYAALDAAPALAEMQEMILDKDPLTEIYDCGSRSGYANLDQMLNIIIDNGRLHKQCKAIK